MQNIRKDNSRTSKPVPGTAPENVFVTGGAGFIGSNLIRYLVRQGTRRINIYDNLETGNPEYTERILSECGEYKKSEKGDTSAYQLTLGSDELVISFAHGDVLDFDKLCSSMSGAENVVHLAAHTRVLESLKDPGKNILVNTQGTFNVIESARRNRIDRFVFASSNAAVGEQVPPVNEKMVAKPLSPYGAGKLFGEGLVSSYFNSYGMKTVALRFANVYGPFSSHKTSVVAKFIRKVQRGEPLEIYGDGEQTRDFIHAEDIAQAVCLALDAEHPEADEESVFGEVYQIATGTETSINELAEIITGLTDQDIEVCHGESRRGEIIKNFSDISKSNSVLGFMPLIQLEQGLKELWEDVC